MYLLDLAGRDTMNTRDEIETFLGSQPPALRRLMKAARATIKILVPSAAEGVRVGWWLLGFSAPRYFAFVAPAEDEVRIGFEHGVLLDDQWGLLEGTGSQVRWIRVRRIEDLEREG